MAREYFSLQRQEHDKGCCHKSSPFVACLLFLLAAIIIAAIITGWVFLMILEAQHDVVVDTKCGKVEGLYCAHSGTFNFKGIPYATPPVGDLRWRPAKAVEPLEQGGEVCWEGMYAAKEKKGSCVLFDHNSDNGTVSGSEDCLYLNVYSPDIYDRSDDKEEGDNSTSKMPVMVFVHGEKGADPQYWPGGKVAKDMGVVVVTPQYRVGPMGFLVLDQEGLDEGNYGITDLIEALVWVKQNIEAFGGNPKDVTIVGQGTGATCVLTLVASPQAKGLFHRAWALSGAGYPRASISSAMRANAFIMGDTNCDDAACLRNVTAEDITTQVQAVWMKEDINNLPMPRILPYARVVVDGKYLIHDVARSMEASTGSDVPLLIGSAAHSVDDNPRPGVALKSMSLEDFNKYLDDHITQDTADDVLEPFYNFTSDKDSEYKLTKLISDIRFTCGHEKMARKSAEIFTSPVHRYIVRGYLSGEVNAFGNSYPARYAFSGRDLYGLLGEVEKDKPSGASDADNKFQEEIREMGMSFIKEEGPNKPEGWKAYPDGLALISDHIVIVHNKHRAEVCKYWDDNFGQFQAEY